MDAFWIALTGTICSALSALITNLMNRKSKNYRGIKALLHYRVYELSGELIYRMHAGEIPEVEEMQNLDYLFKSYSKDFNGNGVAGARYEKAISLYKERCMKVRKT